MRLVVLFLLTISLNVFAHDDDHRCDHRDHRCHDHESSHDKSSNNDAILLGVSSITVLTVLTVMLTDGQTKNEDHKDKRIINAQPDAASYIASDGKINSAYLEQALFILRKQYPNTSDMELAKAVLAY